MKTAKFLIMMVLPLAGFCQQGAWMEKPTEERARLITDWMGEELQLTEEQVPEVYEINLKYAEEANQLKNSQSRREKYRQAKSLDAEKDAELKEVFSDEQFSTYLNKKEELRTRLREKVRENRQ